MAVNRLIPKSYIFVCIWTFGPARDPAAIQLQLLGLAGKEVMKSLTSNKFPWAF